MTDEGVHHLAQCARLKSLDVSHCWKITDAGLAHLSPGLSALGHLDIAYVWQVGAHSFVCMCMCAVELAAAGASLRSACVGCGLPLYAVIVQACMLLPGGQSCCALTWYCLAQVTDASLDLLRGMTSLVSISAAGCLKFSTSAKASAKHLLSVTSAY